VSINRYYITCVLKRPIHTLSTSGRDIITYNSTNILGYIGSQSDNQYLEAGKFTVKTQYKFFTNHFDIVQGDFIVYKGLTYEVSGSMKNTANLNHHGRIYLQKVENVKQFS
jgi:SPP1 family predicted phage head-tail adaptor